MTMAMAKLSPAAAQHRLDLSSTSLRICRALASCGSDLPLSTGGLFLGSWQCHWPQASCRRNFSLSAAGSFAVGEKTVEKLWGEFFSDPSQWWDHRSEKGNAKYPDFKHKTTHESLWVDSKFNPQWVEAELAAMPPGIVQLNIFSWNRRLTKYVKAGQYVEALKIFQEMQREGLNPDRFTFTPVLNACASLQMLDEGRRIHTQIKNIGCELDAYVGSSLINMYAKCGSIEDAWSVFIKMPTRNVVSWNVMILGLVKCEQGQRALELSHQMQQEGVDPDPLTFVGMLNACASEGALEEGRDVHTQIIHRNFESSVFICSSLIDMYAKCGSIEDARRVFDKMLTRDVVAWSAMIQGYVKCGQGRKALELSDQMQQEAVEPDVVTFVAIVNACASIAALQEGRYIHKQIMKRGFESSVVVGSSLIDMYAKCGSIEDAWRVFTQMPTRNVVSWNAMILGHVKCGEGQKALELFQQMQREGVIPDPVTFMGALNACTSIVAFEEGKRVHEQIILASCESDLFVGTSLVDMYAKCGSIQNALRVFNKMPIRNVVSWNALILGYVKCGQGQKALELYREMQLEGVEPVSITFVGVLKACAGEMALEEGKRIHHQIIRCGCESDMFVCSSLVDMYTKCGSIEDARIVFNNMPTRDVVSWNTMILGYVKCGQGKKGLELFQQMRQEGVKPQSFTFVGALNACASIGALEEGPHVHKLIIEMCLESDAFVSSSLVDMYAKCGNIDDAWAVFSKTNSHDVVAWSTMIHGYVKCGQGQRALELSRQMQTEGVEPDHGTFVGLINACTSVGGLEEGKYVHEQIIQRGWESDSFVGTSLIDMYFKCGSMEDAIQVFNRMPTRNVVTWNAMILGLVKCGQGLEALELYEQMQCEGVEPVPSTFVGLLNACASVGVLEEGRHVHKEVIQRGCESDGFVGSSLIDMYAKCGSIEEALRVFKKMATRDVVSWNAIIMGHVKCGEGLKALELFRKMQLEGVEPVVSTFVGVLNACAIEGALEEGRLVHEQIIRSNCESDVFVGSSLVDMYAKCGSLEDARRMYNKMPAGDMVACSAMIHGYVRCGQGEEALELSREIQQKGVELTSAVFVGMLNACASISALEEGKRIHEQIIQNGCESDEFVGNSLVDMYAKCGKFEDASRVLDNMSTPSVVGWTALIQGYIKCGQGQKALELSRQMQQEGPEPDRVTFVAFLNACASVAALEEGKHVHKQIIQKGFESDMFVSSSLIDMYTKCGSIEEAKRVFKKMPTHDVGSWNAMLGGYAMHGHGKDAIGHFEQMCKEGVKIDRVTFISLLSACSHAGLIDEGLHYFESMNVVYSISATVEHYTCMVDLLGRAGCLYEAETLIKMMPCKPDVSLWTSLLGACRIHSNVEMGERIAKTILELDPKNSASYVLLSNIYAAAGNWGTSASIQQQRLQSGVRKQPGCRIELNNEVHSFSVDDQDHPQILETCRTSDAVDDAACYM